MSVIEIHLILNHIPILGVAFVCAQLLIAIIFKQTFMQRVSLWFLLVFASVSIAVYLSGLGAEELVKTLPDVSKTYLQLHEKVARIASITTWILGAIAFLGLVFLRGREELFNYFVRAVLAMSILCTGLFVLTGYLGGQIRHAEIRSTLAEGLTTRPITIGVIAIMAVIIIATGVPLFFNRDKLLKQAGENAPGETSDGLSQQQLSRRQAWVQGEDASTNAHLIQPVQGVDSNGPPSQNATSDLAPLASRQSLAGTPSSFLDLDTSPPNGVQEGTHVEPQRVTRMYGTNQTLHLLNAQYQVPENQLDFSLRPLKGQIQQGYQGSIPSGQEGRPLIGEQPTLPHVALANPEQQLPDKFRKYKIGKRRLFVVLSVTLVCILMAGGLFFTLHRLLKNQTPLQLQTIVDVPISDQTGRFDYQSLDPRTGLLFVSHSGADSALIFDTRSNRVVADIPGIKDGHGIIVIPELGRVYVSSGTANQVVVFDEQTHRILARIPTGAGPDGSAYDPDDHKLFVSDEDGHSDTVIDILTQKQIDIIPVGGEAGNTQYDPVSHRIFVNVQTLNQLVAIDPTNDHIVGRYPLPGCNHNHGLNIDAVQRFAFIACDASNTLLMLDMHTMKVLDTASIGVGTDVLALDSGRHILYCASESGIVSIFEERSSTVHKLAEGYVGIHAHTIAVDQRTHYIYLPLQDVNGKSIMRVALFQP